jgi:hypothetical protein
MYIAGHKAILTEVLEKYLGGTSTYFSKELIAEYPSFTKTKLYNGIEYVDLPCGVFEIVNDKLKMIDDKVCSVFKLKNLTFNEDKSETVLYQFHRGYFAHLHAMSTDPDNTVGKMRDKIVFGLLGYCLLALYDDNVFDKKPKVKPNSVWAGMILHTITDSYSLAHTVRTENAVVKQWQKEPVTDAKKKMELEVHYKIKALAKDVRFKPSKQSDLSDSLQASFKDNSLATAYIQKVQSDLWNTFSNFKFEYTVQNILKKSMSKVTKFAHEDDVYNHGDIVTFQHRQGQTTKLHSYYDFLDHVKKNGTYYRMLEECAYFLQEYKKAINTGDVNTFIKNMFILFHSRTFKVAKRYLNNKTNTQLITYKK